MNTWNSFNETQKRALRKLLFVIVACVMFAIGAGLPDWKEIVKFMLVELMAFIIFGVAQTYIK